MNSEENQAQEQPSDAAPQVSGAERVQHENNLTRLRRHYANEPKVNVYIPSDAPLAQSAEFTGEDGGKWIVVRLSETQHLVPVGVMASVPKTVGEVVEESLRLRREADERARALSNRSRGPVLFSVGGGND